MGYGNTVMGLAAVIGVGTLYVLLHEKKRKRKKLEKQLQDQLEEAGENWLKRAQEGLLVLTSQARGGARPRSHLNLRSLYRCRSSEAKDT